MDDTLIPILESSDPIELAFARGALDDAGIDYVARNEISQLMNDIDPMIHKSIRIEVDSADADRARAALAAALEQAELPEE